MYSEMGCAGLEMPPGNARAAHHQVHIERKLAGTFIGLHKEGAHRYVRDEVTVHHIDMDPVDAGNFQFGNVSTQVQESAETIEGAMMKLVFVMFLQWSIWRRGWSSHLTGGLYTK